MFPNINKNVETMNTNLQSGGSCGTPIDFKSNKLFHNKYFSGLFDYGFPYNMENSETITGFFLSWYSNKVKYSNIWLRKLVQSIIGVFGSVCDLEPNSMAYELVPFILGPLVMSVILGVISVFWWVITLISMFVNENQGWKGILLSVVGLLFGWSWAIPIGLSFVQIIGMMFTMILLPPLLNGKDIMKIIGNSFNSFYILIWLLTMITIAAFTHLNIVTAVVMTIVFIVSLISGTRSMS